MSLTLIVTNDGPEILTANFWEVARGTPLEFIMSLNAGTFRLLLTAKCEAHLGDMRAAKGVAISRGPMPEYKSKDAVEVMFDDESGEPFALFSLMTEFAFDRPPRRQDAGRDWTLTAWTEAMDGTPGKVLTLPCRYRISPELPDLRPWMEP